MRFTKLVISFLIFIIHTIAYSEDVCNWNPQFKLTVGNYSVIETENKKVFWEPSEPISKVLENFYQTISQAANTDQNYLRQRQLQIFKKHFHPNDPAVQMMELIANNQLGHTIKIRCFEMLLLDLHLNRVGNNYYSEYGVHILIKNNQLRLLYNSSDDATVPTSQLLEKNLQDSINEGYNLYAHLHLHPFNISNLNADIGGVAWPSGAGENYGDMNVYVQAHINYGMKQAWVTNGFDTLILKPSEFTHLKNLKNDDL